MLALLHAAFRTRVVLPGLTLLAGILFSTAGAQAEDKKTDKLAEPITKGQRVFTCGHSFHVWVPGIVAESCKKAEIPDHVQIGMSSIGGSQSHSALEHCRGQEQGQGSAEDGQGGCADPFADLPPRRRHRELHQAGPGAQQGHPHRRPAHLAALGHLRADDQDGPKRSITTRSPARNCGNGTRCISRAWTSTSGS